LIDSAALPVETGGHSAALSIIHDAVPKGSKRMTSKQIIAAVGMALIAVPASATTNTVAAKPGKSADADQKKYCVAYDGVVGSRVTKQECKTKVEWAKDRVDIDKLLKGE
jgi:threonine aldolase